MSWTRFFIAAPVLLLLASACGGGGTAVITDPTPDVRDPSAVELFEAAVAQWEMSASPNYERIVELLEDAIDEDATFSAAWFNLGVVYEAQDRRDEAMDAYRRAYAHDDSQFDAMNNLAAMLLEMGQIDEAERILLDIVDAEQFHTRANLNLARIHRQRARRNGGVDTVEADAAINRVRMALAGDSTDVHAYETLADVYFDLGRLELARLVCLNAISMGAESAALHNRLGLIALAKDDVTAAYRTFRQAAGMDPEFIEAWLNLGAIALNYRDYEGALEAFEQVLRVDDSHADAMISRAVALRGLERFTEAEQGYLEVLAIDEDNLAAMFNLGVLFEEYLQDYQAALTWYEGYLRADTQARSQHADAVATRIRVLRELIQYIDSSPPPEPPPESDPGDEAEPSVSDPGPEAEPGPAGS